MTHEIIAAFASDNNYCHRLLLYNRNIWFEGSNAVVCAQMGHLRQIKQKQCTKSTTINLKSFVWFSLIVLCSIKHLMALVPSDCFKNGLFHLSLVFDVYCMIPISQFRVMIQCS